MKDEVFSYKTEPGQNDGTLVLTLIGPLTLPRIFGFQDEFRAMKPPVLIVDLSQSPFLDSAALGLLMNQYVSCQTGHRKLLIAGASERIDALFELTKVSTLLETYPTLAEAEASLL